MTAITLIVSGSIAAVKTPELVRRLRERNIDVFCIVTASGAKFVSVRELERISGNRAATDLFSRREMDEMRHIRFSRETDLLLVAPASADLIAKMAHGLADDMASATLLANNKKLLVAPAMNTQMWIHPATQRNVKQIIADGARIIEPGVGMLACGEVGAGRMAEPEEIVEEIIKFSSPLMGEVRRGGKTHSGIGASSTPLPTLPLKGGGLEGFSVLVTSGPTHEPIDPVRYIANRSSGRQGHAIAAALAQAGAKVTLISGPTQLADPAGVKTVRVSTAQEMLAACRNALPVDVAVCAAAVADWKVKASSGRKLKKRGDRTAPSIALAENPDILKMLSAKGKKRPRLVIGFAAETDNLLKNAVEKRKRKGCDWIVANDVSGGKGFDADDNEVTLITASGKESWSRMSKAAVAEKLVQKIISSLRGTK